MAYTTTGDIILLMNTDLAQELIEDLIMKADAEVNALLAQSGLTVPTPVPANVQRASELLTCALIREREWLSGAEPDQYRIGEYSQTSKLQEQIESLRARAAVMLQEYARDANAGSFPSIFSVVPNKTDTNVEVNEE